MDYYDVISEEHERSTHIETLHNYKLIYIKLIE